MALPKSLQNVDWDLLHQQKMALILLSYLENVPLPVLTDEQKENLDGIVNFIDAIQDDIVELGLWKFPAEKE
jgi:hypothetical protein